MYEPKTIKIRHCLRCERDFWPRRPGKPRRCGHSNCGSTLWDVARAPVAPPEGATPTAAG
ncbi:MAG: hypothetical protein Q7K03_04210 [Dehalococcoidia bacterium]|nr:hypothetical protein [Dehalococcoidia bacterium]